MSHFNNNGQKHGRNEQDLLPKDLPPKNKKIETGTEEEGTESTVKGGEQQGRKW